MTTQEGNQDKGREGEGPAITPAIASPGVEVDPTAHFVRRSMRYSSANEVDFRPPSLTSILQKAKSAIAPCSRSKKSRPKTKAKSNNGGNGGRKRPPQQKKKVTGTGTGTISRTSTSTTNMKASQKSPRKAQKVTQKVVSSSQRNARSSTQLSNGEEKKFVKGKPSEIKVPSLDSVLTPQVPSAIPISPSSDEEAVKVLTNIASDSPRGKSPAIDVKKNDYAENEYAVPLSPSPIRPVASKISHGCALLGSSQPKPTQKPIDLQVVSLLYCTWEGCNEMVGFTCTKHLQQHVRDCHSDGYINPLAPDASKPRLYTCKMKNCNQYTVLKGSPSSPVAESVQLTDSSSWVYTDKNAFLVHLDSHFNYFPIKCDFCSLASFKDNVVGKEIRRQHYQKQHPKSISLEPYIPKGCSAGLFRCKWEDCLVVCRTPEDLFEHVREHASVQEPVAGSCTHEAKAPKFECRWDKCAGKKKVRVDGLTLKMPNKFLCSLDLQLHIDMHFDVSKHRCQNCGLGFTQEQYDKPHMNGSFFKHVKSCHALSQAIAEPSDVVPVPSIPLPQKKRLYSSAAPEFDSAPSPKQSKLGIPLHTSAEQLEPINDASAPSNYSLHLHKNQSPYFNQTSKLVHCHPKHPEPVGYHHAPKKIESNPSSKQQLSLPVSLLIAKNDDEVLMEGSLSATALPNEASFPDEESQRASEKAPANTGKEKNHAKVTSPPPIHKAAYRSTAWKPALLMPEVPASTNIPNPMTKFPSAGRQRTHESDKEKKRVPWKCHVQTKFNAIPIIPFVRQVKPMTSAGAVKSPESESTIARAAPKRLIRI
eukprot:Nk52_evm32s210 gene=Nk52_evmTU32s210